MATVSTTATFSNGVSTIEIPAEFVGSEIWLLVNGQVWTDSNFTVSGSVLTIANIDLSDESVEITSIGSSSDASTASTSTDSDALDTINRKLDALLTGPSTAVDSDISSLIVKTGVTGGLVNRAAIADILSNKRQTLGMNAETGRLLTGTDHLSQSVADILLTTITTRVMRRAYGSDLYLHKDKNFTPQRVVLLYASVALALEEQEPRIVLDRVWLDSADSESGVFIIGLTWRVSEAYQADFSTYGSAANDSTVTQRVEVA